MKIILPASGRTKSEYFYDIDTPKPLLKLDGDKCIMDFQYEILSKYDIPIYMALGYKSEEVMDYIIEKGYDINVFMDHTWEEEYSLLRLIRNESYMFKDEFIMIFSDTLFKDDVVERLLSVDYDVYKMYNARKFSTKGAHALVETVNLNYQFLGLNAPLFFKMQESFPDLNIKFEENEPFWQFDVDNRSEFNQARRMFK